MPPLPASTVLPRISPESHPFSPCVHPRLWRGVGSWTELRHCSRRIQGGWAALWPVSPRAQSFPGGDKLLCTPPRVCHLRQAFLWCLPVWTRTGAPGCPVMGPLTISSGQPLLLGEHQQWALCFLPDCTPGFPGCLLKLDQVFSQDSSAWGPVLSCCLCLYPYSIRILHWKVQAGGSCQHQPLSALILSKSASAHYLWVEPRLLQPPCLTQQISRDEDRPLWTFSPLQISPRCIGPILTLVFFPFLPGYWLHGDLFCSFVYIGDHLQGLWQLLLFLCVCVRTVCWLTFCENCSTCKCASDVRSRGEWATHPPAPPAWISSLYAFLCIFW